MTIEEQHYDFKRKLNKVDSQKYRNMLVPEIDTFINEARELFVKMLAHPRRFSHLGIEISNRATQDLRTLVQSETVTVTDNKLTLPSSCWWPLRVRATINSSTCPSVPARVFIRQHDDDYRASPFDKSNYNWRLVNGVYNQTGIDFDDAAENDITVTAAKVDYYEKLIYVHYAEGFNAGSYTLPGGQSLTGKQDDTQLPEHVHREIVDIAVLIAKGEIESSAAYQFSTAKLKLNDIV